jgi:hypothetical protein
MAIRPFPSSARYRPRHRGRRQVPLLVIASIAGLLALAMAAMVSISGVFV